MQLKSPPSVVRAWQLAIKFAYASLLPERPRRLTGCFTPLICREALASGMSNKCQAALTLLDLNVGPKRWT